MFFVVSWDEPRLVSNVTYEPGEQVPVDMRFLDHLWVPNIFIYDLRSVRMFHPSSLKGLIREGTIHK